jgi:hypothetical protein
MNPFTHVVLLLWLRKSPRKRSASRLESRFAVAALKRNCRVMSASL